METNIVDNTSGGESLQIQHQPELRVYSRRSNDQHKEHQPIANQENSLDEGSLNETGISSSFPPLKTSNEESLSNDLDVPIAIRKGTHSCTMHPIAKYVSYHRLSPNYRVFTTNLSSVSIPRNIQDALNHAEWKSFNCNFDSIGIL
ncbi:hypothetical protein LWI29_034103 [Acer saccharum]|uniref:Uncharacterized protein n=1 Tax=Acer saccharum TaxID=4024 RepID=A0AA39TYH4_ACESA|nr:hypothetical protein LWI29_034103 [Acer saccharum]